MHDSFDFSMYMCVCSSCKGQKELSNPLELEVQIGMSHQVGAGNWTGDLYESSVCP